MNDFDESAKVFGVLDGQPPFGLENGSITTVIKTINEYWVRFGLMTEVHDPAAGVDCSPMADLVNQGYRQTITANE